MEIEHEAPSWDAALEEKDPFSQETLKDLQEQYFNAGSNFYVCRIQDNNKFFYFEASPFLEDFVRSLEKKTPLTNPLTRKQVDKFTIYQSRKGSSSFVEWRNQDLCQTIYNCLPVFIADPSREKKGDYHYSLGGLYQEGLEGYPVDLNQAIFHLKKAEELGHLDPEKRLERCLLDLAFACQDDKAFEHFEQAARRGSLYAIGVVIDALTEGIGVTKDLEAAKHWRRQLPSEWQDKPILEFINSLC